MGKVVCCFVLRPCLWTNNKRLMKKHSPVLTPFSNGTQTFHTNKPKWPSIHPSFSLFSLCSGFSSPSSSSLTQPGNGLPSLPPMSVSRLLSSQSDGRRYCCECVKGLIQHKKVVHHAYSSFGKLFDTEARYLVYNSPLKREQGPVSPVLKYFCNRFIFEMNRRQYCWRYATECILQDFTLYLFRLSL